MIINVRVSPRSSKNEIIKISDNTFKIKVTMAPEKGKANATVIEMLSEYFQIAKSNIKIIAGHNFHEKIMEVKL